MPGREVRARRVRHERPADRRAARPRAGASWWSCRWSPTRASTCWSCASSASASGAIAFMTRPLIVAPWPRPVTRDSQPVARPAVTATRVRVEPRLTAAARTSRRRRGTGCATRVRPAVSGWVARISRTSSSTRACSSGGSTATWLTAAKRPTTPSGDSGCSWRKTPRCSCAEPAVEGQVVLGPALVLPPRCLLLDPVHDAPDPVDPVDAAVACVPHQSEAAAGAQRAARARGARPRRRTSGTPGPR